jgi:hypothetical protein
MAAIGIVVCERADSSSRVADKAQSCTGCSSPVHADFRMVRLVVPDAFRRTS